MNINNNPSSYLNNSIFLKKQKEEGVDVQEEANESAVENELGVNSNASANSASTIAALNFISKNDPVLVNPQTSKADDITAKLAEFKALGITIDSTDPNIINNITVTKDAVTGKVTITGLNGTVDNVIKLRVDDSVKELELASPAYAAMSTNSKTKITDTGVVNHLLIHNRCDLDVNYDEMMTITPSCGSVSIPSASYYAEFNYNPENGAGSVGAIPAWQMEYYYPGFTGLDLAEQTKTRIDQLKELGVILDAEDEAALSADAPSYAGPGNSVMDFVMIVKDPTTGEIKVSIPDGYGSGAKKIVEDILAKAATKKSAKIVETEAAIQAAKVALEAAKTVAEAPAANLAKAEAELEAAKASKTKNVAAAEEKLKNAQEASKEADEAAKKAKTDFQHASFFKKIGLIGKVIKTAIKAVLAESSESKAEVKLAEIKSNEETKVAQAEAKVAAAKKAAEGSATALAKAEAELAKLEAELAALKG